jgi:hypothetical protein
MSGQVARLTQELFTRHGILRAIEMAALLPATMLLAPMLMAGSVGMGFALVATVFGTSSSEVKVGSLGPILLLLMLTAVGYASLACLWVLLLGGMWRIRSRPALRRSAVLVLLLGLADAAYFLLADREVKIPVASTLASIAIWAALLGLPMLLGVRYVYLLLRPDDGAEVPTVS